MGSATWDCAAVNFLLVFLGDKLRTPLDDAVIVLEQGGLDDNFDQWQHVEKNHSS